MRAEDAQIGRRVKGAEVETRDAPVVDQGVEPQLGQGAPWGGLFRPRAGAIQIELTLFKGLRLGPELRLEHIRHGAFREARPELGAQAVTGARLAFAPRRVGGWK